MINGNKPLIVVDAGHGGWDNGASYNGRMEKDDNLRLALEVERQLRICNIPVLMTRTRDVYVTLEDRAKMANEAEADLFVSLHRNSYIEQTPTANGVENFIYLTAPAETTGRAAQDVLDSVVSVGVQSNRGVSRGNYYVLRRTVMPAMLLEMGFIINDLDNRLFDENLNSYAVAIVRGIMNYFGLCETENPCAQVCPPPDNTKIKEAQRIVSNWFGIRMPISGVFDSATKKVMIMVLQMALNSDFNAGLYVDGILGAETLASFPNVRRGSRGNVTFVVQALLQLNRYDTGELDGVFGSVTNAAVLKFQQDHNLVTDGIVGRLTLQALLDA